MTKLSLGTYWDKINFSSDNDILNKKMKELHPSIVKEIENGSWINAFSSDNKIFKKYHLKENIFLDNEGNFIDDMPEGGEIAIEVNDLAEIYYAVFEKLRNTVQ